MKVCLCAVLGSNDLHSNNQTLGIIGEEKIGTREGGKKFLDKMNSGRDIITTLQLPLLSPTISKIQEEHKGSEFFINLFYTDQQPPHKDDTVYFKEIIEKVWSDKFPNLKKPRFTKISENPSLYDTMWRYFEKFFTDQQTQNFLHSQTAIYVSLTGGTPAANFALALNAIRFLNEKVKTIYLPHGGNPLLLHTGRLVFSVFFKREVSQLLECFDFSGAAKFLKENPLYKPYYHYTQSLALRLDFAFEDAFKEIKQLENYEPEYRDKSLKLQDELKNLQGQNDADTQKRLLKELIYNLEVMRLSGRWLDFLGRTYRLHESILRIIIEEKMQIPTNDWKLWKKAIENKVGLKDYLNSIKVEENNEPLKWENPNTLALQKVVDWGKEKGEVQLPESLSNLFKICEKLRGHRNHSPYGHEFRGISPEKIREIASDEVWSKYSNAILEFTGNTSRQNPLSQWRDWLKTQFQ